MAVRNALVRADPSAVWAVLADGHSYDQWVVGTLAVRAVDPGWPQEGTSLHYTLGLGPLQLNDRTTVRLVEPGRSLELEALVRPVGSVRISIQILRWGEDSVVVLDEHPLRGPSWALENPITELAMTLRNRAMLHRLVRVVESRATQSSR
jgi:Polyketide cyclase / dehydrase and lipid transport